MDDLQNIFEKKILPFIEHSADWAIKLQFALLKCWAADYLKQELARDPWQRQDALYDYVSERWDAQNFGRPLTTEMILAIDIIADGNKRFLSQHNF